MSTSWLTFTIQEGMDAKSDPKVLPPGQFTELYNGSFDVAGAFTKRSGHREIGQEQFPVTDGVSVVTTGGDLTSSSVVLGPYYTGIAPDYYVSYSLGYVDPPKAIASKDNELLVFNGRNLYTYGEGQDRWRARAGSYISTVAKNYTVKADSATNVVGHDVAVFGDYEFHAYVVLKPTNYADHAEWQVIDAKTRAVIGEGQVPNVSYVRVIVLSNGVGVFIGTGTNSVITMGGVILSDPRTLSLGSALFNVPSDGFCQPDACALPGVNPGAFVVTYLHGTGNETPPSRVQFLTKFLAKITNFDGVPAVQVLPYSALGASTGASPDTVSVNDNSATALSKSGYPLSIFPIDGTSFFVLGYIRDTDSPDSSTSWGSLYIWRYNGQSGLMQQSQTLIYKYPPEVMTPPYPVPQSLGMVYNPSDDYLSIYIGYVVSNTLTVLFNKSEQNFTRLIKVKSNLDLSTLNVSQYVLTATPITKPFAFSGSIYNAFTHHPQNQPTAFLLRERDIYTGNRLGIVQNTTFDIVSKFLPRVHAGNRNARVELGVEYVSGPVPVIYNGTLAQVNLSTTEPNTFKFAMEKQGKLLEFETALGDPFTARSIALTQASLEKLAFSPPNSYQGQQFRNALYVPGAELSLYDGKTVTDVGFNLFPDSGSITLSSSIASGVGNVVTGTFQYCFTYQSVDNNGVFYESRPSAPRQVVVPSFGSTVNWTIPGLNLTNKPIVQVAGYRTVALETGGAGAGSLFYRFTSAITPVTSSRGTMTVSLSDNLSDNALTAGRPTLYTTTELANNPDPVCSLVCSYRGRIVLAGDEQDGTKVWFSKKVKEGSPVAFTNELYARAPDDGTDITAIATLSLSLIIFKENFIYYFQDDGPDNDGVTGTQFREAQRIASPVGCTQPKSIVEVPKLGLLFKSNRGIYLLTAAGDVNNIGRQIENLIADEVISSAVQVPDLQQVRFTCSSSDRTYVFDYSTNRWHIHTGLQITDSTMWKNQHVKLLTDNTILIEDPTQSTDNGQEISTMMTTGWINLSQLIGEQQVYRVLVLGEAKSHHTLNIRAYYDGNDDVFDSYSVDSDLIVDSSAPNMYIGGCKLERTRCRRIKISVFDSNISAVGAQGFAGLQLTGVALEVAALTGKGSGLKDTVYAL